MVIITHFERLLREWMHETGDAHSFNSSKEGVCVPIIRNQFAEWTDNFINNEIVDGVASTICGWNKGEVMESLRAYATGAQGSRTIEKWAVTLKRFYRMILNTIIVPILATHDTHGTLWFGLTRVGKSTASKTCGFAVSGFQIEKHARSDLRPSVVTTKKLDFLRHEPGTVFKPMVADDTIVSKWGSDDFKATL